MLDNNYTVVQDSIRAYRNSYPSKNGLKPSEIMVLSYYKSFNTSQTEFQKFWLYTYGIENVRSIISLLVNNGFLVESSAEDSMAKYKNTQIKEILRRIGASTTGHKEALIERIISLTNHTELESLITIRTYELTDLGKRELSENEYVTYYHNHYDWLGVWWMNKRIQELPNSNFKDILWGEYNRALIESFKRVAQGNYEMHINVLRKMIDLLLYEDSRPQTALSLLIQYSFYDVNNNLKYDYTLQRESNPSISIFDCINVDLNEFKYLADCLNFDDSALFSFLSDQLHNINPYFPDAVIPSYNDFSGIITSLVYGEKKCLYENLPLQQRILKQIS